MEGELVHRYPRHLRGLPRIAFALTDTGTIATIGKLPSACDRRRRGDPSDDPLLPGRHARRVGILRFTKPGKYAYAIGGNEAACRMLASMWTATGFCSF